MSTINSLQSLPSGAASLPLSKAGEAGLDPLDGDFPALRRSQFTTLQVNLGYRCNQSCSHCHVDAGPHRLESMDAATVALVPAVLEARQIRCLDLTGGAPELHPLFRDLVHQARAQGVAVIDRCNLTILQEAGQEDLAPFLADQGVKVVASMPCYLADNVDRQRGRGVFERSIAALRELNALGYGQPESGLQLDLVFNPQGAVLPPPQELLETDFRKVLASSHGVVFNNLLALANMPIQRFGEVLRSRGELDTYRALLRRQHRDSNLPHVMCRSLVSVDWRGFLHDCDFNQQLGLGMASSRHLADLLNWDPADASILVGEHCFGCTAGGGSSCGGALS